MAYLYQGKVELKRMPQANSIKPIGEGDRAFTGTSKNQFTNETANECFKFMVASAKKLGIANLDVWCPDMQEKYNTANKYRFTLEQIQGFDFTEYSMSFRIGGGMYLQIVKPKTVKAESLVL